MSKKTFLTIFLCTFFLQIAFARPVSKQQAIQVAKNFLEKKRTASSNKLHLIHQENTITNEGKTSQVSYYVFTNDKSEGFIIISGNDQSEPILGYSDEGSFSADDMPENMRYWLEGFAVEPTTSTNTDRLNALSQSNEATDTYTAQVIAPLLETSWNQIAPYNLKCFMGNNYQSYTGCVATAMGQVMHYYKWPTCSIPSIPAYTADNGYKYLELPPLGPFNWNIMKKAYILVPDGDDVDESVETMTDLMLYCGHAVKMIYKESSAGAHTYEIIPAMRKYFGYSDKARLLKKKDFCNATWSSMIDEELENQRPIMYFGSSSAGSAHAFVIDGCDGKGMYHINWGAGGKSNGYFLLNALRPSVLGEEHSAFDNSQSAIFGLSPQATNTPALTHLATHSLIADTITAQLDNKTLTLDISHIFSSLVNIANVDEALGLYRDGKLVSVQAMDQDVYVIRDSVISHNHKCQITLPSTDGKYIIKALNRESGDEEWDEDKDADSNQIYLTFSQGRLSVHNSITNPEETPIISMEVDDIFQDFGYGLQPIKLQVKVRNTGTENFNGTIYLGFNDTWEYHSQCVVDKGMEETANFFVDKPFGTYNMYVYLKDGNYGKTFKMGKLTLTNNSPLPKLEYVGTSFKNVTGSTLYGNVFDGTITLRNPSNTDYNGEISYYVIHGDSTFACQLTDNLEIKSGETVDMPIRFDNLEFGEKIHIENIQDGYHTYYTTSDTWTVKAGMVTWDANGERKAMAPSFLMRVPENAVAASFEGLGSIRLTPNSNPNTIYYLDYNTYPPISLSGKNVVLGDSAKQFTLVDGRDFYIPMSFHANTATFTRTPTIAFDGKCGWTTIMLPFTVDEVSDVTPSHERELQWGATHSPILDGKDFWLKKISSISDGNIYLSNVRQWSPNMAYLMAIPDRNWGPENQLLNHQIAFKGHDVKIIKTPVCKVIIGNHELVGTTNSHSLSQAYQLNSRGDGFTWTTSSESKPYGAYLTCDDPEGYEVLNIVNEGLVEGDANGDGNVNILDALTIANHIINLTNLVFIKANADADNNNIINVIDLMEVINIILMQQQTLQKTTK